MKASMYKLADSVNNNSPLATALWTPRCAVLCVPSPYIVYTLFHSKYFCIQCVIYASSRFSIRNEKALGGDANTARWL